MKKRFICVFISLALCGLLGLASISLAAEEPWVKKVDMPTARNWFATCTVNGKIYAIGGWNGSADSSALEEYDTVTDTWVKKADMPTARRSLSASVVNGKIYAIGGWNEEQTTLSIVEEYDPVTDTWTKKANMLFRKGTFSASVVSGRIYVFGGFGGSRRAVEEYDPVTNIWTRKTDMPTPRTLLANHAPAVNGKIYVIGGRETNQGPAVSAVEEYDPMTDTWTKKTDMPTARGAMAVAEVNGKIYAIGGQPDSGAFLRTVEEYDPVTDTWAKKEDMPTGRMSISGNAVNGKIYVIGGWNGSQILRTVEKYNWLLAPERMPQSVNAQGKLATQWGSLKATEVSQ